MTVPGSSFAACVLFCCVLGSLIVSAATATSYNETAAYESVTLAAASYCTAGLGAQGLADWTCHACTESPIKLTDISELHNSTFDANAYVGYAAARNTIVLGFAGTDPLSVQNWIDDLVFFFTDYTHCPGCRVHEGFLHSYQSLQEQIMAQMTYYQKKYPTAAILITGHSLGAALGLLAAIDLTRAGFPVLKMYNFGQPRVGNAAFAVFANQVLVQGQHRVTHNRDPVPHLCAEILGFKHVPHEIFYNELETSYKVCADTATQEDSSCSDGQIDFNLVDHLNYLRFDFVSNYLSCKL